MQYELWDSNTGERIACYGTEDQALSAVYARARQFGALAPEVRVLWLLGKAEDGSSALFDGGVALVERAYHFAAPRVLSPSGVFRSSACVSPGRPPTPELGPLPDGAPK